MNLFKLLFRVRLLSVVLKRAEDIFGKNANWRFSAKYGSQIWSVKPMVWVCHRNILTHVYGSQNRKCQKVGVAREIRTFLVRGQCYKLWNVLFPVLSWTDRVLRIGVRYYTRKKNLLQLKCLFQNCYFIFIYLFIFCF